MGKPKLSLVKQPPSEFYKQQPNEVNELNGYYYIHLHQKNVGRMYEGANLEHGLSDNDIASKFAEYKNENLTNVVTNQYMQGLQASIHQVGPYSNLIQNAFSTESNGSQTAQILDTFNEVLEKGFEQSFNMNKVNALLLAEHKARWKGRGDSINALQELLNGQETKKGLDFLDLQLQALADTVKLIQDSVLGKSLEQALVAIITDKTTYNSSTKIGAALMAELNKDKYKKLNGSAIQVDEVKTAIKLLKDIASYLENKENNPLSADSLRGLLQNQFFSTMAEFFWMNVQEGVTNSIFRNMAEVLFEQTGQDDSIEVQLTDPITGKYIDNTYMKTNYLNVNSKVSKASGKADGVAKNISIGLDSIFDDGAGYGELTMDLRISNKAYVTNHFGGSNDLTEFKDVYGLGGGMNIGPGLDMLMASNINNKYLAYNVLCRNLDKNDDIHGGGFPQALTALQDVLLTRNIVYLAAGRGKKDFSQLLLLNGHVMSIWSIIKYVLNQNVGISESQIKKIKSTDSTGTGVYLSLDKTGKIYDAVNEFNSIKRTKQVNSKIANKSMHLHIVPKKIIEYARSVNNTEAAQMSVLTK